MTDVYLHIGLPKTGTSSVQSALQECSEALAEHDVVFAGGSHQLQRMAVYDLLGRRIEGDEGSDVAGSWQRLVDEIDACTASSVVVSEENLTLARPRQVRRLMSALGAHPVYLVISLRDLGRVMVSSWQTDILGGHTFTWSQYVAAIRDPAKGPATAGVVFQLRFDLIRILDIWEQSLPRERVRLVTVPPPGNPPELLLDRFGAAIGVPPGVLRADRPRRNEGLGAVEVEMLRRLNVALRTELTLAQHTAVLRRCARPGSASPPARPLALPQDEQPWVADRAQALAAELRAREYEVHGDLKDLTPRAAGPGERRLDDVTEAELLPATEQALRSLSLEYASLWKRHRRLKGGHESEAPVGTRLTSSARAAGFGVRAAALEKADRNRLLAWLARRSVKRS
jgi:hypothetical protein